jgi:hypothetical protein
MYQVWNISRVHLYGSPFIINVLNSDALHTYGRTVYYLPAFSFRYSILEPIPVIMSEKSQVEDALGLCSWSNQWFPSN